MNKLKLTSAIAAILIAGTASAENILFNGTVTEECSIVVNAPGDLTLSGTGIATDTAASVTVSNNADGAFNLTIDNPSDFNAKPAGYTGAATLTSSMDLTGVNTQAGVTDSVTLTNHGADSIAVNLSGSTDEEMIAGSYNAVVVMTCVAL